MTEVRRRRTPAVPIYYPDWLVVKPLSESIERLLGTYARGVLLDAGCGSSPFRGHLPAQITNYLALDLEPAAHVDLVGSITAIPLGDKTVDSVLCSQVLEHVYDLDKALQELHRVLKPGGCLIISAPQYSPEHERPHDFHRFTSFALRRKALDFNFEIAAEERQGGGFSVAGWAVNCALADKFLSGARTWAWYVKAALLTPVFVVVNAVCRIADVAVPTSYDCINRCIVFRKKHDGYVAG